MAMVSTQSVDINQADLELKSDNFERAVMRKLVFAGILATFLFPALAFADDVKGTITVIDQDNNTIELDNGKTYSLPGEFDYSVLNEGMKVIVFYDTEGNNRYVTDIEPQEG